MEKTCECGSGKPITAKYDGYRIFLCNVCEECEAEKMAKYRPDIHERYISDEPIDEEPKEEK